jgi:hypothetical protein
MATDLCVGDNVSKRDANALMRWWSRKGHVYKRLIRKRRGKRRYAVWLQR